MFVSRLLFLILGATTIGSHFAFAEEQAEKVQKLREVEINAQTFVQNCQGRRAMQSTSTNAPTARAVTPTVVRAGRRSSRK